MEMADILLRHPTAMRIPKEPKAADLLPNLMADALNSERCYRDGVYFKVPPFILLV